MIQAEAKLTIKRLGLHEIQICEYQQRYVDKLLNYVCLLLDHPGQYAGLLFVQPSKTHTGMYELLDGHHKFCASVMAGRPDALCVLIEQDE
jgi:hypothetical protein